MRRKRTYLFKNRLSKKIIANIFLIFLLATIFSLFFVEKANAPAGTISLKDSGTVLQVINCTTDKSSYYIDDTVTFYVNISATIGDNVSILIANSITNLDSVNYTNRANCIANSSNILINDSNQDNISITMSASAIGLNTWYAKVCNEFGNCSCLEENTTAWNLTFDSGNSLNDEAKSVAVDTNNNVYVAGYGTNLNGSTEKDWWIKKFYSDGTEAWSKNYDGKDGTGSDDEINCIITDPNNIVYAVGYGTDLDGDSNKDRWIMNFSDEGIQKWNKIENSGNGNDESYSVAVDNSDNVYIVGYGKNINTSHPQPTQFDWWIEQYSRVSLINNINWEKKIDGNTGYDQARDVAVNGDHVYIVGDGEYLLSKPNSQVDWWMKQFNVTDGIENTTWNITKQPGTNQDESANSITIDSNHNVYIAGYRKNQLTANSPDWWIKKYNSTGIEDTTYWNKTIDGDNGIDEAMCIANDSNNNIFVVGYGTNLVSDNSGKDWAIIKFNETGTILWNETCDYAYGDEKAYSIAIDDDDNIYVVGNGTNLNGSTLSDWWIKKFEYIVGYFSVTTNTEPGNPPGSNNPSPSTNIEPTADAGGPYNGVINENIIFDSSGSVDIDGTIVSYSWDFGDGTTGTGLTTTHAYSSMDNYTVTLTVTDDGGATGTDTAQVIITNGSSGDKGFTPILIIKTESKGNITQGKPIEINITDTIITKVILIPAKNLTNVNLTIKDYNGSYPSENFNDEPVENDTCYDYVNYSMENFTIYRYVDIDLTSNETKVLENDLDSVKIQFKVDNYNISKNNFTIPNGIYMLRDHNNTWDNLTINYLDGNETGYSFFEAESPGLSTFAVVGSKVVEKDKPYTEPRTEIPWIIIIGFIILAIVILLIILIKAKYIYVEEVVIEDKK